MSRYLADILRVSVLLVLTGVLLYLVDPANAVIFQALGIGLCFVGGTHLTRRILFHRLDLQTIASKAVNDNNLPAAIVFASLCACIIAFTTIPLMVLK